MLVAREHGIVPHNNEPVIHKHTHTHTHTHTLPCSNNNEPVIYIYI